MTFGSHPYGSVPFGGGIPPLSASFDIEKKIDGRPIILVAHLFGQSLIEYFHKHPLELKRMDRRRFEELVAELFDGFGYQVELTQRTRDGGKDIIAIKHHIVSEKFLIECKRPEPYNKIGVGVIRELLGVKEDEKATKAILVTTAFFSLDAQLLIDRHEWELEGKDYHALKGWIDHYLKLKGL
jgi:hypothetical protein